MREIKFRVWDKEHKMFLPNEIYDIHSRTSFGSFGITRKDWRNYSIGEYFYDNAQILEQYTGLKDKNGKEIYEGDIVKTEYGVGYSSKHYPSYKDGSQRIGKLTVEWEHCGFNLQFPYDGNFEMTFEVIGNIHQNPDLL